MQLVSQNVIIFIFHVFRINLAFEIIDNGNYSITKYLNPRNTSHQKLSKNPSICLQSCQA